MRFENAGRENTEKKLGEIASRIREAFFDSIKGEVFHVRNHDTGVEAKFVEMGLEDSAGGRFVKEVETGRSRVVTEAGIFRSKEGTARMKAILDREGLSGEERVKVLEELGL